MKNLPTPTKEIGSRFTCWQVEDNGVMIHSACNIVSPEMLYIVDSTGENYEKRQEELSQYEDVLEGVSVETTSIKLLPKKIPPAASEQQEGCYSFYDELCR